MVRFQLCFIKINSKGVVFIYSLHHYKFVSRILLLYIYILYHTNNILADLNNDSSENYQPV